MRGSSNAICANVEGSLPDPFLNEAIRIAPKHGIRLCCNLLASQMLCQSNGKGRRPAEWGVDREKCRNIVMD